MSTSLEQRIATALADDDASSTLSALIEEIEGLPPPPTPTPSRGA